MGGAFSRGWCIFQEAIEGGFRLQSSGPTPVSSSRLHRKLHEFLLAQEGRMLLTVYLVVGK